MASIRQSIRSSTASKRPTSAIADGQIALNTASGTPGMFFKDNAGNIIKAGPAHYGATAPNSSPAVGGSTGNSLGEAWLDSSLTPAGWKVWNGAAWVNATPLSSDTVQGLVELATNAETQAGVDSARAVTAASLQSKVSDSVSTASASGIASSAAVKTAYDLANAALPKSGGIITGNLEIGTTGSLTFEGSTADGFETTLAVVDPTLDRTITFPNITGTVVTTGDTGTVTSTMIADNTIVNAEINSSAAIAFSKLASLASANILVGNASGVPTATAVTGDVTITNAGVTAIASNVIVNADINTAAAIAYSKLALSSGITNTDINASAAIAGTKISPNFGSQNIQTSGTLTVASGVFNLGTAAAPSITISGDLNTGIYSPGADQLAITTSGTGRLFVDGSGNVGVGGASTAKLDVIGSGDSELRLRAASDPSLIFSETTANKNWKIKPSAGDFYFQYSATAYNSGYSALATLTSSGNFGIGTGGTAPGASLHVAGAIASAPTGSGLLAGINGNYAQAKLYGSTGGLLDFGASGADANARIRVDNSDSALQFFTKSGSLFERMRLDSSGNLGIGVVPSAWGAGYKVLQTPAATFSAFNTATFILWQNGYYDGTSARYVNTGFASNYQQVSGQHIWNTAASGTAGATISFTQAMTLDASGRLGIGGTSSGAILQCTGTGSQSINLTVNTSGDARYSFDLPGVVFNWIDTERSTSAMKFGIANSERMRITSGGAAYIGQTTTDTPGLSNTTNGISFRGAVGDGFFSASSSSAGYFNRNTTDGTIVSLRQDGVEEGTISVSGTTVSYNGAHLSRWSQLPGGAERTKILRGSVLSNIGEMCEWPDEDNEQLNRMKVSDVEGDKNVAGVFQAWDDDDDTYTNDFYCAMAGDFIIRIAEGVTVERGDLLMSAGDGTAKPQDDDIIRSKTIAKVTSTNVSCTYEDGSYCVPCVLMAC